MEEIIPKIMAIVIMIVGLYTIGKFLLDILLTYSLALKCESKREYELFSLGVIDDIERKMYQKTSLQKYCNHKSMRTFELPIGYSVKFTPNKALKVFEWIRENT